MIKKSIFTLMFVALMGYVSAQSFQLEWNGSVFADGETYQCTHFEDWGDGLGEFIQHFQVRNLMSNDISIAVKKEILEDLPGSMIQFCWAGQCYNPEINESRPAPVAGNTVSDMDMSLHAILEGLGKVVVRFTAFNADAPDTDKVTVDVVFANDGTGVAQNMAKCSLGHAYPNPASSVVRFNYEVSSADNVVLTVYNLLGQEVMNQPVSGFHGQVSFAVDDLTEGIYFCNLTVNGRAMKTEKFIIKK